MEDKHFYELYNYFNTQIKEIKINSVEITDLTPSDFSRYSLELVSKYIGECNRNINQKEYSKDTIYSDLENNRIKFQDSFKHEFDVEFSEFEKTDIDKTVSRINDNNALWVIFFKIKFRAYESALKNLDQWIKDRPKSGTKHVANRDEFCLDLNNEQFEELLKTFKDYKLLHDNTLVKDFIDAFTGKENTNFLVWIADAHLLYLLIKKLNNEGFFKAKFTHGLWEIVIDIFRPQNKIRNNTFYEIHSLTKSNPSKNKDYNGPITVIADEIKTLIKEKESRPTSSFQKLDI